MTPDSLSPMKSFLDESPIDGIPIQGTDNKSRVPNNKGFDEKRIWQTYFHQLRGVILTVGIV